MTANPTETTTWGRLGYTGGAGDWDSRQEISTRGTGGRESGTGGNDA